MLTRLIGTFLALIMSLTWLTLSFYDLIRLIGTLLCALAAEVAPELEALSVYDVAQAVRDYVHQRPSLV